MITIYAIGRTEQDSMQPKVPYYTNVPNVNQASLSEKRGSGDTSKLKSFVNRLLNRDQMKKGRKNRTRISLNASQHNARRSMAKKIHTNSTVPVISPAVFDDYSDEPPSIIHLQLIPAITAAARSPITQDILTTKTNELKSTIQYDNDSKINNQESKLAEKDQDQESDDSNRVQSEQWIAYERHLYEKYLDIVSQSIDLILHTILASWMALLLDEDSDQCFGTKNTSSRKPFRQTKEAPVYNYNGAKYSIRPDIDESPTRVVVRR